MTESLLLNAIKTDQMAVLKFLLSQGVRPGPNEHLLHLATERNNAFIVSFLLKSGLNLNINEVDENGATALFYAKSRVVAKLLVDNGINVMILNKEDKLAHEVIENAQALEYVKQVYSKKLDEQSSDPHLADKTFGSRFSTFTLNTDDIAFDMPRGATKQLIVVNGVGYEPTKRFKSSLFRFLKLPESVLDYFSFEEVLNRVKTVRTDKDAFRLTVDNDRKQLLGVIDKDKPVLPIPLAMEVLSTDKRISEISYSKGVIKATFDLHNQFKVNGDSLYDEKIVFDYPVDALSDASINLGFFRQVCSNGAVAQVAGFRTDVIINEASNVHLKQLLESFDNEAVFNTLIERIKAAQETVASVQEVLEVQKVISRTSTSVHLTAALNESLEEIAGDPCAMYRTTSLSNISANRRRALRTSCNVNSLINFLSELQTHYAAYLCEDKIHTINNAIGKLLLNNFDLEGLETYRNTTKPLYLENFSFDKYKDNTATQGAF